MHHLKKKPEGYVFGTSHRYYRLLKQCAPTIEYLGSRGALMYVLAFLHSRLHIVGLLSFLFVYCSLGQFVWQIDIEGVNPSLNTALLEKLESYGVHFPSIKLDATSLEMLAEKLREDFKDDIDWLNFYRSGSSYHLAYTPRISSSYVPPDQRPLIALEEGIIDRIEVSKGKVCVQQNQYVKKGQLLVDNTLISTSDEITIIPVEGKVFAYTWKIYEASMPESDQADAFSHLRLAILRQVAKDLGKEDSIVKENVLQYRTNEGKITLRIHFTLYQNIASKGD